MSDESRTSSSFNTLGNWEISNGPYKDQGNDMATIRARRKLGDEQWPLYGHDTASTVTLYSQLIDTNQYDTAVSCGRIVVV